MPMTPIKADDLFAAWSRGVLKPIYLFTGQEDFLIEEALKRLSARRFPKGRDSDTNRDRLDAEKSSAGEVLQAAQTVPFGGPCRWVEVHNASRFSSDDQKILAEGLTNLLPTTQLIFIWGKEWRREDAGRPLVEAVSEQGSVVIFWPLFPEQAQRWLLQRAKHYKKTLSPDAAAWLVQESSDSLRRLDQELIKVSAFVGERSDITQEDVEACSGYGKALSPYEWLAALRQKNYPRSLGTLRQLLDEDEEPLKLLAMVTGSLQDWIQLKEVDPNAAGQAKRSRWGRNEEQSISDLAKRPAEELVEGLSYCVETHQSIKTGKETPSMALTLLTLRLCGLPAGRHGPDAVNPGR